MKAIHHKWMMEEIVICLGRLSLSVCLPSADNAKECLPGHGKLITQPKDSTHSTVIRPISRIHLRLLIPSVIIPPKPVIKHFPLWLAILSIREGVYRSSAYIILIYLYEVKILISLCCPVTNEFFPI